MTAAQEIQAAIDKLTGLRESSTYIEINGWLTEGGCSAITNDPLIVTLHRTIDAQLAILDVAVAYGELGEGEGSRFIVAAKLLARAINGATS